MRLVRLSVNIEVTDNGQPLTEFRILKAGVNKTTKGDFLFDARAAESVMAAHKAASVDGMIDLEHLSLDQSSPNYDPDARGWYGLELRDGELWATGVQWAPDGVTRLTDRRQRYISPAFSRYGNRVKAIVNLALVAMPATYEAQPLIAASQQTESKPMKLSEQLKAILAALQAGDAEKVDALLQAAIAEADAAPDNAPDDSKPDETAAVESAVTTSLLSETGATDVTEALSIVKQWGAAQAAVNAQRATIELTSRRALIAELVKLGVETPATAWQGEIEKRVPVVRLSTEPLDEMRARVGQLKAAKGTSRETRPAVTDATVVTLSAVERENLKARGVSETEYTRLVTQMRGKSSAGTYKKDAE